MSGADPGSGPVIRIENMTRTLDGEVPVTLVKDVSLQI